MVSTSTKTGLFEILEKIKAKPGMYIGRASISNLFMFLVGYETARDELGIEPTEAEMDFYENFHDFLQKRYNLRTSNSWANIILFHCGDEKQAFERFFKLLAQFQDRERDEIVNEETGSESSPPPDRVRSNMVTHEVISATSEKSDREAYQ